MVLWPAWLWIKRPNIQLLTASHELKVAVRDSTQAMELVESDWYQSLWGEIVSLSEKQKAKDWYINTRNGHRQVVSVGSGTTGKKGDILIIDDPNDTKKVQSEVEREKCIKWHDNTFYNRVNNLKVEKNCRIYIGQRTHSNDLFGHLFERFSRYEHINLPEEFDPKRNWTTSIGWSDWRKKEGEFLRPNRFAEEEKKAIIGVQGQRQYETQYNQNVIPEDGAVFKKKNFRFFCREYGRYRFGDLLFNEEQITNRFLTCDHASTVETVEKPNPDWTVVCAWGTTPNGYLLMLKCYRQRMEAPEIPKFISHPYKQIGASKALIEGGGPQRAVYQLARRYQIFPGQFMNCVPYETKNKDKLSRSVHAQAMFEAGRIWFPMDDPSFPIAIIEKELLHFSGNPKTDEHDDIVDNITMAAEEVRVKEETTARIGITKLSSKPLTSTKLFWLRP